MKKIKRIIWIIIIFVLAFVYAHIAKANNIYDKRVDNSEYLGTGVVIDGVIEQKFICVEEKLDGIKAKVQILGDVRDVQIAYRLVDDETEKCVASGKADAAEIKPSRFFEFAFDTVNNTKDKTYTIIFENVNAEENKGVGFFFQPVTEEGTYLNISGNKTEGTLILKSVTNRFDFETFAMVLIFVLYIVLFMKFLYRLFK